MTWKRMGEWMYRSTFLDLSASWRRVVSFTTRPLYSRGKSPWYPLAKRLGGPRNRSGRREENSCHYRDSNSDLSVVHPVASRYTDCAIPATIHPYLHTYIHTYIKKAQQTRVLGPNGAERIYFLNCGSFLCGAQKLFCNHVLHFKIPGLWFWLHSVDTDFIHWLNPETSFDLQTKFTSSELWLAWLVIWKRSHPVLISH
jgi:hypothetical protein